MNVVDVANKNNPVLTGITPELDNRIEFGISGLECFNSGMDAAVNLYDSFSETHRFPVVSGGETWGYLPFPFLNVEGKKNSQLDNASVSINWLANQHGLPRNIQAKANRFMYCRIVPEMDKLKSLYETAANLTFTHTAGFDYHSGPLRKEGIPVQERSEAWRQYGRELKRIQTMGRALQNYLGIARN